MATYTQAMQDSFDENTGSLLGYRVGKESGTQYSGALRFSSVSVPKNATIVSAELTLEVSEHRHGSNQDIYFKAQGIDEDNTASFSTNSPFGRSRTTAETAYNANINNDRFRVNVKAIVEEITTRNGWSSGNNMGFLVIVNNASSPNNVWWEDDLGESVESSLTIVWDAPSTSLSPSRSRSSSPSKSISPSPSSDESDVGPGIGRSMRISLPGYNAFTDRNLDHFSLYTDEDNVLIKEHSRGAFTTSSATTTITHGLGYVPFYLAYVLDTSGSGGPSNTWQQIGNADFSVSYYATCNTTTLTIGNATGSSRQFIYYIFYDNVVGASQNNLVESSKVMKIARRGRNALRSKDPNDYIFHSDLNTFKILKEGTQELSYTANNTYSFIHGAPITTAAAFMLFVKFPDESITMSNGTYIAISRDSYYTLSAGITATHIQCYITGDGSARTIKVKYYIFETPLS